MIEQSGVVIENLEGRARLRFGRPESCELCAAGKGCGGGLLGRLTRQGPAELALSLPSGMAAGTPVILSLSETHYLRLVLWVYGMPLLAGLGTALLAWQWVTAGGAVSQGIAADLVTLVAGLAGAALGLLAARRRQPGLLAGLQVRSDSSAAPGRSSVQNIACSRRY